MLKPIILPLSIAMSLLCVTHGTAVAQVEPPGYVSVMRQPGVLPEFPPILKRTFVPVDVRAIDGPRRLAPDESGFFSARANVGAASLPIRSRWDFGDGHTASGLSARHQFAQPGTYAVTFRIWNEQSTDADTLVVTVGEQGTQHSVGAPANAEASYQRDARMQE